MGGGGTPAVQGGMKMCSPSSTNWVSPMVARCRLTSSRSCTLTLSYIAARVVSVMFGVVTTKGAAVRQKLASTSRRLLEAGTVETRVGGRGVP